MLTCYFEVMADVAIDLSGCYYNAPTRSYQDCRIQLASRGVKRSPRSHGHLP